MLNGIMMPSDICTFIDGFCPSKAAKQVDNVSEELRLVLVYSLVVDAGAAACLLVGDGHLQD